MTTSPPNNMMATISAVSAAVTWLIGGLGSCLVTFVFPLASFCTGLIFLAGSITSLATGYSARSQIKASGGAEGGDQLATAGIISGWIGIGLTVVGTCLFALAIVLGVASLSLLGPEIGNVFSEIIIELETPVP